MADGQPHIIITIDTKNPIEIGDFVSSFTSVASQYDKFMKENHPDLSGDARILVKEVSRGPMIADLIPVITIFGASAGVTELLHQADVITDFVLKFKAKLLPYFEPGGSDTSTNASDLKDFMGSIAAIANDPAGSSSIESAYFSDGQKNVTAAITFNTHEAREASKNIETKQLQLQSSEHLPHERVMMVFTQSNVKNSPKEKRTGEKVVIEEISIKERPLIYASDLAEQQIKHEIREADENVYKKGFIVDVMIQSRGGRACAYKVTNLHQVIDLSDE